ncbi:MAG TPA: AEC family transporter [Steroidobacteraceae bacterium]|nr:AEC family transporter [Steroidobacteraceae bacterium]
MTVLWSFFKLSSPLYGLVGAGYLVACLPWWQQQWSHRVSSLIFAIALPAMLFQMMSHQDSLPAAHGRVLIAYFGSCLIVFLIGRGAAAWLFRLDGTAQSVFGLGGVFSNIVLTGLPIAKLALGATAVPVVALLLVFNALILWTLVSVSVEWSRHGSFSAAGFARTAWSVLRNPIILAIIAGSAVGRLGLRLPAMADTVLLEIGNAAAPAALLAMGLGLAAFRIKQQWASSLTICALKLLLQPLVVWLLAIALALPAVELRSVVLVASMAVGVNVYLMSVQFQAIQGTIASSIVLSNVFAALTTPLLLAAVHATS